MFSIPFEPTLFFIHCTLKKKTTLIHRGMPPAIALTYVNLTIVLRFPVAIFCFYLRNNNKTTTKNSINEAAETLWVFPETRRYYFTSQASISDQTETVKLTKQRQLTHKKVQEGAMYLPA